MHCSYSEVRRYCKMNSIEKFKTLLREHTFRLLNKNDKGELTGFASCFVWQSDPTQIPVIITAGHGLELTGALIETSKKNADGQPLLLDAGDFKIFYSDDIDFAHSKMPLKVIKYLKKNKDVNIPCYIEEIGKPILNEDYGFSMVNNFEFMKSGEKLLLPRYECSEVGMKFILEDSGCYYFKTVSNLKDDDYYSGASGSPIADREGRIVSILTGRSYDGTYLKGACLDELIEKIKASQ